MTENKLQINRPEISSQWTPEQVRAAAVRVHNRFAGLVASVIESADWANYRLSSRPIEVGRPAWPDPGEYCDLVLQRRNGPAEVALEIKTRYVKGSDHRPSWQILDSVLDHMGAHLNRLQRLAHESEALWCVALGLYHVPFMTAARHYETSFEILLVWGRDIGRDSPMSRARFGSLAELDRALCSCMQIDQFFTLQSLPRSKSAAPEQPRDIEELIAHSGLTRKRKLALLAVHAWPSHERQALRTYLRNFATEQCSEYALKHYVMQYIDLGIITGYERGSMSHALQIDEPKLIAHLLEVDRD